MRHLFLFPWWVLPKWKLQFCLPTHHSQSPRMSWQARLSPSTGRGTEPDVLNADYCLAFPELSRLPKFLESCVLCSPMGFHGKRRAQSTRLLPKETKSRGSHGVWGEKKSNSGCWKYKKYQRHNEETWESNKDKQFPLSTMRLDGIQILKSLTVMFLGTHYNGKILKNPPTNAAISNSIPLVHFFRILKSFKSENSNFLLEV